MAIDSSPLALQNSHLSIMFYIAVLNLKINQTIIGV